MKSNFCILNVFKLIYVSLLLYFPVSVFFSKSIAPALWNVSFWICNKKEIIYYSDLCIAQPFPSYEDSAADVFKHILSKKKISIIEWITYDWKWKTLWQEEKLLIMSNFPFCHNVFKYDLLQSPKKTYVCEKGLRLVWPEASSRTLCFIERQGFGSLLYTSGITCRSVKNTYTKSSIHLPQGHLIGQPNDHDCGGGGEQKLA